MILILIFILNHISFNCLLKLIQSIFKADSTFPHDSLPLTHFCFHSIARQLIYSLNIWDLICTCFNILFISFICLGIASSLVVVYITFEMLNVTCMKFCKSDNYALFSDDEIVKVSLECKLFVHVWIDDLFLHEKYRIAPNIFQTMASFQKSPK